MTLTVSKKSCQNTELFVYIADEPNGGMRGPFWNTCTTATLLRHSFTIVWQYLNQSRFDRVIIKCTMTHLLDHNVQIGYYTVSNRGVGVRVPEKSKDSASRNNNVRQHKSETYQQLIECWQQQAGSSIYQTHTSLTMLLLLTKILLDAMLIPQFGWLVDWQTQQNQIYLYWSSQTTLTSHWVFQV